MAEPKESGKRQGKEYRSPYFHDLASTFMHLMTYSILAYGTGRVKRLPDPQFFKKSIDLRGFRL